jgi:hypothetical protein
MIIHNIIIIHYKWLDIVLIENKLLLCHYDIDRKNSKYDENHMNLLSTKR